MRNRCVALSYLLDITTKGKLSSSALPHVEQQVREPGEVPAREGRRHGFLAVPATAWDSG